MTFSQSFSTYFSSILTIVLTYLLTLFLYRSYCKYTTRRKKRNCKYATRRKKRKHRFVRGVRLTLSLLPVSLLAALRGIEVGADTLNVWSGYLECLKRPLAEQITIDVSEFFYDLFRWLVCRITNGNVQVFFFLLAFLTLLFVVFAINKWNIKYKCLALFIFLMLFGPNLMNQSRQMLSVAIMVYSFSCLYKGSYKQFVFWSIIAIFTHFSAIIAVTLYLFVYLACKKNRVNVAFLVFLIALAVSSKYLIAFLGRFVVFEKYTKYFENTESFGIGLGLLLLLIPTIIPTVLAKKEIRDSRIRNTIYLTAPIRIIGYYSYFLYRITYYFSGITMVALPVAVEQARGTKRAVLRISFIVLPLIYFLLFYCWKDVEVYMPYYAFWDNNLAQYLL